ncbi:MAG: T9SS type A sorting domain-containing protein [Bacteroidota bacterium]
MKQPALLVALVVAVLVSCGSQSVNAQSFVVPLTASSNDSVPQVRTRGFGILPSASVCIDTADNFGGFQEAEQPPFPPSDVFEIYFKDPLLPPVSLCFGEGSGADFRPAVSVGQADTFYIQFQPGGGGYPISLSWPAGLASVATSMRIVDAITMGSLIDVDMLTTTNFNVANPHTALFIIMEPIIIPVGGVSFTSLTPAQVFDEDPLKPGKSSKPAKRVKAGKPINMPNWSNVLSELTAQGGFQPGTSESDIAGGMVVGISYMENVGGKFKPIKDSANIYSWVRLTKWDAAKALGKSHNAIQKTLRNKAFVHETGVPRGFDSTLTPGAIKRKPMKKQATKLDPKKTPNRLFAELVALKVNIAASALGKTNAGFGELIYDRAGNPFDEMEVKAISQKADSMMTYWQQYADSLLVPDYVLYDSLYYATKDINAAFSHALDTLSWQNHPNLDSCKLVINPLVDIGTVSYMRLPDVFIPTIVQPTNNLAEAPEDFESADYEDADLVPTAVKLFQNFPNPFNPTTNIAFNLVGDAQITVSVYNMLGQEVGILVDGEDFEAGVQTIEFDASALASGVYFYRVIGQNLETGDQITPAVGKMILMK